MLVCGLVVASVIDHHFLNDSLTRIDGLIALALEHGQNETAALLLHYKEEKLGYRDTWSSFEL